MHISIHGSETCHDDKGNPYTVYVINVRGSRNVVRKRFREFVEFQNECHKIKPQGLKLPTLPPKKWSNTMDPNFVFNR
eukprot:Ihof_evm6s59 gene=Ihof_evmTU6s59